MFDFQGFLKCNLKKKTSDPTENMLLALCSLLTMSDAMFVKNELKWLAIVFNHHMFHCQFLKQFWNFHLAYFYILKI